MSRIPSDTFLAVSVRGATAWTMTSDRVAGALTTSPAARRARAARSDDRGEGVISAAIVVLIMAAIGALMWTAFSGMWEDVESDTRDKIDEVGS